MSRDNIESTLKYELVKGHIEIMDLKYIRDFVYDNSDNYGILSPLLKLQLVNKIRSRKGNI